MSRRLEFRSEAAADILSAVDWYERQRTGLGSEFSQAFDGIIRVLGQLPEAGPVVHRDLRRVLLRRFPYAVYYQLHADRLEIVACLHTHRNPRTWRQRA